MKKIILLVLIVFYFSGCFKWFRPDNSSSGATNSAINTANASGVVGLTNWLYNNPKKVNYCPSINAVLNKTALAKWDIIILPPDDLQRWNKNWFGEIRQLNPKIKILLYASSSEIPANIATNGPWSWLKAGISPSWYLRTPEKTIASFWPGNYLLNGTSQCPIVGGKNWASYLAEFLTNEYLKTGLWDGVFLDTLWNGLSQINQGNFDANNDGVKDNPSDLDNHWREGMQQLVSLLRERNPELAIIGNGNAMYQGQNGLMLETFPIGDWKSQVDFLQSSFMKSSQPVGLINSSGEQNNLQEMRFGLASSLLLDNVYYSYDAGESAHGEAWWYPEYDLSLGQPRAPYYIISGALSPSIMATDNFSFGWGNYSTDSYQAVAELSNGAVKGFNLNPQIEWTNFLTSRFALQANKTYSLTFDYSIVSAAKKFYLEVVRFDSSGKQWLATSDILGSAGQAGTMAKSFTTDNHGDYVLSWGIEGQGAILIDNIVVTMSSPGSDVFRRDYEKGIVLVNPSAASQRIILEKEYRTISGTKAKEIVLEAEDGVILLNP